MMPGKQISGDSFTSNFAGMSKNQLYEIMSQMKGLIEQNQQQARGILVENPSLTKALFQAQIMLGMVRPPQVVSNVQQAPPPKQSAQSTQQLATPASQLFQDQSNASATQIPIRKQQQIQPPLPNSSTSVQPMPSHPLQPMGHPSGQMPSMSLPQSSHMHNLTSGPIHSAPLPPPPTSLQSQQVPVVSSQPQQSLYSSGIQHVPLQPPLPSQPRPPSLQPFQHHMGSHLGYQPSSVSQSHISQSPFSSLQKPPGSIGSSFSQGQPPLPSQPPPSSLYQVGGGLHSGTDFSGQTGNSIQVDRPSWLPPGLPETTTGGMQLPGPPTTGGQMGVGSQPPRPPPLTPEMEQALLQQVRSLTPEQINLLPPEQRNQVLQLQQMLR